MTFDEIALEEQEHIISDLKREIRFLHNLIDVKDVERAKLVKENKELQRLLDDTRSDLIGARNDYKQTSNEVNLLNKQLDRQNTAVNDLADIVETSHKVIDGLKEENDKLKFRLKMLTKVCLNSIYGITGTDNIKETTENDSNN